MLGEALEPAPLIVVERVGGAPVKADQERRLRVVVPARARSEARLTRPGDVATAPSRYAPLVRSRLTAALAALLACQSSGSGDSAGDDGGVPPVDQGRTCSVEAPADTTYADDPGAFVEACACFFERLFANGPERGCQLVGILWAGAITGMPDPDGVRERSCGLGYDACLENPRWLTPEGRTEICEQLFDSGGPCETLEERLGCHAELLEHEARLHGRLSCEWPQPVPLPCGLTYGC